MNQPNKASRPAGGFTLVELAVVVVIIGVLAAFAVPRFLVSVERSKASEAFNYASTLHSAQERYLARQGTYADSISKLDTLLAAPVYFTLGAIVVPDSAASLQTGWELTFTRAGSSAGYGAYTIAWGYLGYDATNSTIVNGINPFQTSDS